MLNHIGLQYPDRTKAEIFFSKILGLSKTNSFSVSAELAESIFGIGKEIDAEVYGDDKIRFEIFYSEVRKSCGYEHICLAVPSKKEFISRCKSHGIEPISIRKDEKDLLFIRDFSGYLYEIKEE